jgi:hypothetical protein
MMSSSAGHPSTIVSVVYVLRHKVGKERKRMGKGK